MSTDPADRAVDVLDWRGKSILGLGAVAHGDSHVALAGEFLGSGQQSFSSFIGWPDSMEEDDRRERPFSGLGANQIQHQWLAINGVVNQIGSVDNASEVAGGRGGYAGVPCRAAHLSILILW